MLTAAATAVDSDDISGDGSQRGPAVTRGGVPVVMVAGRGPKNPGMAPEEARRSPVAGWPSLWLLGGVPRTLGWLPKRPGSDPVAGALSLWLLGGDPRTPLQPPRGPVKGLECPVGLVGAAEVRGCFGWFAVFAVLLGMLVGGC
jgi:hypothetical protein